MREPTRSRTARSCRRHAPCCTHQVVARRPQRRRRRRTAGAAALKMRGAKCAASRRMRRPSARSPHHGFPQGGAVTSVRLHQRGTGAAKWLGRPSCFFGSAHSRPAREQPSLRWQAQCVRVRSCSCLARAWISRCRRCRSRKKRPTPLLRMHAARPCSAPARAAVARSAAGMRAASRRNSRRGATHRLAHASWDADAVISLPLLPRWLGLPPLTRRPDV
jgi:hypothetical protein